MTKSRHEHDEGMSNPSDNQPFTLVLEKAIERRKVIVGGLTLATGFFAQSALAGAKDSRSWKGSKGSQKCLIEFKPVLLADGNGPVPAISADYQYEVLIPWGTPLEPGGPEFQYPPKAQDQAKQVGIGHDGMAFFPIDGQLDVQYSKRGDWRHGNHHGLLAINHEYGGNTHILGKSAPESLDDVRTSQHAHGVSVVEIKKSRHSWSTVASEKARRIHVNTPVSFSGPAAGHPLLQTPNGNVPLGTVNNCASGATPWGTYLTCEENFNGYFGASNNETTWAASEMQARYGFSTGGFGYGWHLFDRRFDLSDPDYKNEDNRFGWVVEIDPYDATQMPVKRTSLGRFKHEGATTVIGKGGRAVVYMGDDERFDYIYKFVSADNYKFMLANQQSPLDHGDLYVARFNDDGSGDWLKLSMDNPALAEKFADQAEILVYARAAADMVGATPMDRPEWTTVAPNGDVYCTLTNNSRRTEANGANPLAPNPDGHIIRWHDSDQHVGTKFTWDIFLIAQETHGTEASFASPDGLWADPDGRLFIQTDGGQKDGLNNQLLVADTATGELRRLLTGVTDDEITGITVTPDRRTLFVNLQHPGNGDPNLTNFPAPQDGVTVPRDCTLVITRKDGGIVGS